MFSPTRYESAARTLAAAACAVGVVGAVYSQDVVAQDVGAGRTLAASCAVCHGAMGLSSAPDAPNLAGQPALYLSAQLRAYRSGQRRHEVMGVIAKPLSDADIASLAAWFSSIKVKAEEP